MKLNTVAQSCLGSFLLETMEYFPLYGLVLMVLVAKSQETGESIGPFFSSPPSSTPTVLSRNCFMSQ